MQIRMAENDELMNKRRKEKEKKNNGRKKSE